MHTAKIQKGQKVTEDQLAKLFTHKAESFAGGLTGVQTFWLHAFYGKNEPEASHPFRVTAALAFDESGMMSEPATDAGQRAQNMRQTEALIQGTFRMNAHMVSELNTTLQTVTGMLTAERNTTKQLLETLGVMTLDRAQNNHAHQLELAKLNRQDQLLSQGLQMLPGAANNLLGREVFPQNQIDSQILDQFISIVVTDPEKFETVARMLPAEMQGVFADRVQKYLERRKDAATTSSERPSDDESDGEEESDPAH